MRLFSVNSVDSDEAAHHEPSHQDLRKLTFQFFVVVVLLLMFFLFVCCCFFFFFF